MEAKRTGGLKCSYTQTKKKPKGKGKATERGYRLKCGNSPTKETKTVMENVIVIWNCSVHFSEYTGRPRHHPREYMAARSARGFLLPLLPFGEPPVGECTGI